MKDYDLRTLTQVAAATGGSYVGTTIVRSILGAVVGAVGGFVIVSIAMDLLDRRMGSHR